MIDLAEQHLDGNALCHVMSRVFDTPLMILPSRLEQIADALITRLQHGPTQGLPEGRAPDKAYGLVDGVAVLSYTGTLVHRGSYVRSSSGGMQGYTGLSRRRAMAQADPEVHSLLYEFDTPGGEVSGAFEHAEELYADRQSGKPQMAVVSDTAASAGYLMAAAVGNTAISETSQTGSVGVVMRHLNRSKLNEKMGVSYEYIYAGKHKIDGNPDEPLPAAVREKWQGHADHIYTMFVDAVAKYRRISAEAVRETEAAIMIGSEAIKAGFADRVSTPAAVLQQMRTQAQPAAPAFFTLGRTGWGN